MNFKEIIRHGFTNPVSRKNIIDYFIRHYKIAEQKNYSLDEFFDGCFEVISYLEKLYDERYLQEKKALAFRIKDNKDRLQKWKDDGSKGIYPTSQEFIDKSEDKLNRLNKETFKLVLTDETYDNRKINYNDLVEMKSILTKVKVSLEPKKSKKYHSIEPLNFELNQSEVIYLFDILQEAGFLDRPILHDGSYYRKLESNFTAKKIPIKDAEQKRNKYLESPLKTTESIKSRLIEAIKKMP